MHAFWNLRDMNYISLSLANIGLLSMKFTLNDTLFLHLLMKE